MSLNWNGDPLDGFTGVLGEDDSKSQSQLFDRGRNHQAPLSVMGGFFGSSGLVDRCNFRDQFRCPILTQQGIEHAEA